MVFISLKLLRYKPIQRGLGSLGRIGSLGSLGGLREFSEFREFRDNSLISLNSLTSLSLILSTSSSPLAAGTLAESPSFRKEGFGVDVRDSLRERRMFARGLATTQTKVCSA